VALWAEACGLVVLGAVDIWTIVKGAVPTADGTAAPLVHEVPVETGVGPVLCAFVLHEEWTLLCTELLQESHRSASPAIFETTGQINFFRCFLKPTIQATNGLRGVLCMSAHQKTAWHPHEIIVTDSYEPPCGC
ncbi:hypothetical protein LEMLEM_LOCUS27762, partial [Lemmus lemmus]